MPSAWTPDHQSCPNPSSQSRKYPSRLSVKNLPKSPTSLFLPIISGVLSLTSFNHLPKITLAPLQSKSKAHAYNQLQYQIDLRKSNIFLWKQIFWYLRYSFFIQWQRNPTMNWWDQRWCTHGKLMPARVGKYESRRGYYAGTWVVFTERIWRCNWSFKKTRKTSYLLLENKFPEAANCRCAIMWSEQICFCPKAFSEP